MNLQEEQARIERNMVAAGAALFRSRHEEALSSGNASRSAVMGTVLDSIVQPVADALETVRTPGRQKKVSPALLLTKPLEASVVAYLAVRTLVDRCQDTRTWASVSMAIGSVVELEVRMAGLALALPGYASTIKEDLDHRSDNADHRRAVIRNVLSDHPDDEPGAWTHHEKLSVGSRLLDLTIQFSGGLFAPERFSNGKTRSLHVVPTERFFKWIGGMADQMAALHPFYSVCVVPPKDWDSLYGGGYHTDALAYPLSLVKTRSKAQRTALKTADLSRVYDAVNLVQRTPWAINEEVLKVAEVLIGQGGGVAGLPALENEPLPAKPEDFLENKEANVNWRRAAARVYDSNRRLLSKRLAALRTLAYAKDASKYASIYFPYQLDFRGRIYSVPQVLSPQGADLAKGLLVFEEGDPVVPSSPAADWLYIHGANCAGVDKVGFGDRKKWVFDNLEQILQTGLTPLDTVDWWGRLDAPFQFLSWAIEFTKWYRDNTYRPRVPIGQDGTCNGLQHYAALLRDPVAGAAVNLVPADRPSDIYSEVARVVQQLLRGSHAEHSDIWKQRTISRSVTKRPVMVLPYGGTFNSCLRYVEEAVLTQFGPDVASNQEAVKFLALTVWNSISEVVVSARLAMSWVQRIASEVTKGGRPLQWTAPSGFVVVQDYEVEKTKRVNLYLMSGRVQTSYIEGTGELSRARQRNGSAPNFVHSLDASALVETVRLAGAAGLTKFAVIHDSFGTTAGHSEALAKYTRDAFVSMYEGYSLEDYGFDNGWIGDPPPFIGGLDIQEVKNSKYFFA